MTVALVLPTLGDDGSGWRDALPGDGWEVLDQPGHGVAPAPRCGAYDPMAVLTLARWRIAWSGVDGSFVVGVGEHAMAAAVLAAGGGCAAVALVDGLLGRWVSSAEAVRTGCDRVRRLLADPAALAPPPLGAVDPKTAYGYALTMTPRVAKRAWETISVPTLLVETPDSPTPAAERAERQSWFGGPTTLVEVPDAVPSTVLGVLQEWSGR